MEVGGLRLPDFIIGGAARAGTTWLYTLAERHPGVAMARPLRPEPKFFRVDDLFARGPRYYSETWFAGLPPGKCLGEKSTSYLESPVVADRLRETIPAVKMVFLLRDPVDRAYSNFLWSRANGMESADFETALALEDSREAKVPETLRYARPHAYFSRGLYAQHLERFFSLFPREQILVLRHEDIPDRPREVASALHRFLGVEERPEHAEGLGVVNAIAPEAAAPLDAKVRRELARRYAEPNRRLASLLGGKFQVWSD